MIQTFVWSIICLFTLLIKKNCPHPYSNGSMNRKKYMKMFHFCPRDPWSVQPTTCSLQLSYPHKHVVGGPPSSITAAEQQASPRTLRAAIKRSMTSFPWRQHLNIDTNPTWQVKTFTDTFLNIMSNFIPNETKRFVPRDPPWITKNKHFNNCKKNGYKPEDKVRLESFRDKRIKVGSNTNGR